MEPPVLPEPNSDLGKAQGTMPAVRGHQLGEYRDRFSRRRSGFAIHGIRAANEKGVAVGAHPSFADRENFGRKELLIPIPRSCSTHVSVSDWRFSVDRRWPPVFDQIT